MKPGDIFQTVIGKKKIMMCVVEVHKNHVVLDANHPMAGRTLTFDIQIVE